VGLVALSFAAIGWAAPATGPAATGTLSVSATVLRHTTIRMEPPHSLTISAADVARGYVEWSAPVDVTVQSNAQEGYALVFQRDGGLVRQAEVQGLDGMVVVGEAGATAPRQAAGRGMWRDTMRLRFRFDLAADVVPGEHPWPLNISLMTR
jgi:hypothetical protein